MKEKKKNLRRKNIHNIRQVITMNTKNKKKRNKNIYKQKRKKGNKNVIISSCILCVFFSSVHSLEVYKINLFEKKLLSIGHLKKLTNQNV